MKLFFFAAALAFVTVSGAKAQDQATVVASCGTAHLTAGTQAFRTVDVNGVTCSGAGSATATLFLYTGESNSGGKAPNSPPPPSTAELLPHSDIQILNNTTLTLQTLQIGVNNLIGQQALTDNVTHGSELGWALAGEAGRFPTPVFLVKTGQGGSQISDWTTSSSCGYWNTLVTRYNAAVAAIHALGYANINTIVMYSQGINDAAGTDTNTTCHPSPAVVPLATWVAATQAFFSTQLRPLVGANVPIIMSKFAGSPYPGFDVGIDTITGADSHTTSILGDSALWQPADQVHRSYAGYRNWAELYVDNWLAPNGQASAPSISPAPGSFASPLTVTITPVGGEDVYYSSDGSDPLTYAQKYTGPFTVTTPATVKARGVLSGKASSAIVANAYTAVSGGGCAQATAYLGRTVGGNEGGNGTNISNLICGLVTDGVIDGDMSTTGCGSKLDALWIMAQQNRTDADLNLCGTSYSISEVALQRAITFTSYQGYSFTPNSYLSTGFNPATATSPKFVRNSANYGFWSYAVVTEASYEMGNGAESTINNSYPGPYFLARVNEPSAAGSATPGTNGLFVGDRSSSANVVPYWNGIAQPTQASVSVAPTSVAFIIGFGSAQTISAAHIGSSLGSAGNLALYNRLRTYMTAVGVP